MIFMGSWVFYPGIGGPSFLPILVLLHGEVHVWCELNRSVHGESCRLGDVVNLSALRFNAVSSSYFTKTCLIAIGISPYTKCPCIYVALYGFSKMLTVYLKLVGLFLGFLRFLNSSSSLFKCLILV